MKEIWNEVVRRQDSTPEFLSEEDVRRLGWNEVHINILDGRRMLRDQAHDHGVAFS